VGKLTTQAQTISFGLFSVPTHHLPSRDIGTDAEHTVPTTWNLGGLPGLVTARLQLGGRGVRGSRGRAH